MERQCSWLRQTYYLYAAVRCCNLVGAIKTLQKATTELPAPIAGTPTTATNKTYSCGSIHWLNVAETKK